MADKPIADETVVDTEPGDDMHVITLTKPVTYEDDTVTELRLDFDSMTGSDLEHCEREWMMSGSAGGVPETSKTFLMHVVARASGKRVEIIKKMAIKDVSRATLLAQNFLLG